MSFLNHSTQEMINKILQDKHVFVVILGDERTVDSLFS